MSRIRFEPHGDEEEAPMPVEVLMGLFESGKAGDAAHRIENGYPTWDILCGLEDALIVGNARLLMEPEEILCSSLGENYWEFIVGETSDPEVSGWLKYGDCIIVPYGPERKAVTKCDIGVWKAQDFTEECEPTIVARAPCCDGSGILINAQMRPSIEGLLAEVYNITKQAEEK